MGVRSSTLIPVASSALRSTGFARGSSFREGLVRVVSIVSLLENLFENNQVGRGTVLYRSILRDNFQDVGSRLVESLFHRIL
jgi:hypothetical protein